MFNVAYNAVLSYIAKHNFYECMKHFIEIRT